MFEEVEQGEHILELEVIIEHFRSKIDSIFTKNAISTFQ